MEEPHHDDGQRDYQFSKEEAPKGWDYVILPRRIHTDHLPQLRIVKGKDYYQELKELVNIFTFIYIK